MKNKRVIIILVMCVCAVIAWGFLMVTVLGGTKNKTDADAKKKDDREASPQKMKVWALSELYYNGEKGISFETDAQGRVVKAIYAEADVVYGFEYIYQDGEPITRVTKNEEKEKIVREYNSKGNLLKQEQYAVYRDDPGVAVFFPDGNDYHMRDLVFDERGNQILEEDYYPDGSVETSYESKYDENGYRISYIITNYRDGQETVTEEDHVELDSSGRLLRSFNDDGQMTGEVNYFDDGRRVETWFGHDGQKIREYQYDSKGNLIRHTMYTGGEISRVLSYEYQKTENGYKMIETYEDFPDGPFRTTETEYDLDGNEVYRHESDSIYSEYAVKDDSGRIIRTEKRFDDGSVRIQTSTEYDEYGNRIALSNYGRYEWKYTETEITKEMAEENARFFFDDELYRWTVYY